MTQSIRVYVNGNALNVAATATAVDAVTDWDAATATQVRCGAKVIVDNRGLPIPADSPAYAGAIFRVVSARQGRTGSGEPPE